MVFRNFLRSTTLVALVACGFLLASDEAKAIVYDKDLFWPTPNYAFIDGLPPETYLQPTNSGRVESGDWGCTRDDGEKFHEGVDLKSIHRNIMKTTDDKVFCIADGFVAHVNRNVADSNYGLYVVVSHYEGGLEWFSLYAHLSSIDKFIEPRKRIQGGETIGVMGNTSSSIVIPESHSHLHLEIGLRASSQFDLWYLKQHYDSPNQHGSWNGINLIGTNPLAFYRYFLDHPDASFSDYFRNEALSFEVLIHFEESPDFLNRNPVFLSNHKVSGKGGWYNIGYTWYGLPVQWTALTDNQVDRRYRKDQIYIRSLQHERSCRKWVKETQGSLVPTSLLQWYVSILKAGDGTRLSQDSH